MPEKARKTTARTQLVHGWNRTRRPVTGSRMSHRGELWGSSHQAKSPVGSQVLLREMFLVQRGNERGTSLLRAGAECVVVQIWGKVVLASNVTNSASPLSRLMISPTRFRRTPSLLRTPLYSDRISSVTSQVKVSTSIQSRRNEALGFCTSREDLNPATPATSTDVSTTPLGCFVRRPNRDLRQRLLPSSEASNCIRNLGFCYTGQILCRRLQGTREVALPA